MYHSAKLLTKEGSKLSTLNPAFATVEITHHALPGGKSVVKYRYDKGEGWVWVLGWYNSLYSSPLEQKILNKLWRDRSAICEF